MTAARIRSGRLLLQVAQAGAGAQHLLGLVDVDGLDAGPDGHGRGVRVELGPSRTAPAATWVPGCRLGRTSTRTVSGPTRACEDGASRAPTKAPTQGQRHDQRAVEDSTGALVHHFIMPCGGRSRDGERAPGRERLTAHGRSKRRIWNPGLPRPGARSAPWGTTSVTNLGPGPPCSRPGSVDFGAGIHANGAVRGGPGRRPRTPDPIGRSGELAGPPEPGRRLEVLGGAEQGGRTAGEGGCGQLRRWPPARPPGAPGRSRRPGRTPPPAPARPPGRPGRHRSAPHRRAPKPVAAQSDPRLQPPRGRPGRPAGPRRSRGRCRRGRAGRPRAGHRAATARRAGSGPGGRPTGRPACSGPGPRPGRPAGRSAPGRRRPGPRRRSRRPWCAPPRPPPPGSYPPLIASNAAQLRKAGRRGGRAEPPERRRRRPC